MENKLLERAAAKERTQREGEINGEALIYFCLFCLIRDALSLSRNKDRDEKDKNLDS